MKKILTSIFIVTLVAGGIMLAVSQKAPENCEYKGTPECPYEGPNCHKSLDD